MLEELSEQGVPLILLPDSSWSESVLRLSRHTGSSVPPGITPGTTLSRGKIGASGDGSVAIRSLKISSMCWYFSLH